MEKTRVAINDEDTAHLFTPEPLERLQSLTKDELIFYIKGMRSFNEQLLGVVKELQEERRKQRENILLLGEQFVVLTSKVYGKSSERAPSVDATAGDDAETEDKEKKAPRRRVRLPSERYPDAGLIEEDITLQDMPACKCCGEALSDSGITEDREFVTKIPEQYFVTRQKRHKYRCSHCHGDLQTAPAPPQIKPGSAFSDEFIQDVAVSKFCDLIPIGRQVKMAERHGMPGLPPQSLIETTHYLAEFLRPVYEELKEEVFLSRVVQADETPHRMLEGDSSQNWYFWGFSGATAAYFEAHNTRSGDVASNLLKDSACEVLVSDVYSGYKKATREANEYRDKEGLPRIQTSYCNAHARRKFKEAEAFPEERDYFMGQYQRIYHLESKARDGDLSLLERLERLGECRRQMLPIFEEMKAKAMEILPAFSSKSSIGKALEYFLKNYDELVFFSTTADVPIDNNGQERLLRNPVIGRKTWYGTHSKQGAKTTAVLFSVMESCKINGVNPRAYLRAVTAALHAGQPAFTPAVFAVQPPRTE